MSERAEDLNEWRSEQYAKNAKSYELKVWLTVEEAKQALGCIIMSRAIADDIEGKDRALQLKLQERIEKVEGLQGC